MSTFDKHTIKNTLHPQCMSKQMGRVVSETEWKKVDGSSKVLLMTRNLRTKDGRPVVKSLAGLYSRSTDQGIDISSSVSSPLRQVNKIEIEDKKIRN